MSNNARVYEENMRNSRGSNGAIHAQPTPVILEKVSEILESKSRNCHVYMI